MKPKPTPSVPESVVGTHRSSDASLLDRIVSQKEREVRELAKASTSDPLPPLAVPFRFASVLRRPAGAPLRVIAECKQASPSMGLIRAGYDPAAIARAYQQCGAAALSVLTDREFFQGDLSHITAAASAELPILRKDFMISGLQIREARRAGAEAILLIVRILSELQLSELRQEAEALGMSALVEVHSEPEAELALRSGASLIGINHRDLDSLQMDLSLTERIAPGLRQANPELVLIAESGVESHSGLARVEPFVDGVLIGTALLRSSDIPGKWSEIFAS
jgi:indole-3-glycerol phosphate synthase